MIANTPVDHAEWSIQRWEEILPEADHSFGLFGLRIEQVTDVLNSAQKRTLRRFSHYGISGIDDFRTLALIRRAGDLGMTVSELADFLGATRGAISNRIQRLYEQDILERHDCDRDRRSYKLTLNRQGKQLVDEMYHAINNVRAQFFSQLNDEQLESLSDALATIARGSLEHVVVGIPGEPG